VVDVLTTQQSTGAVMEKESFQNTVVVVIDTDRRKMLLWYWLMRYIGQDFNCLNLNKRAYLIIK
jgi:hypothetical protein